MVTPPWQFHRIFHQLPSWRICSVYLLGFASLPRYRWQVELLRNKLSFNLFDCSHWFAARKLLQGRLYQNHAFRLKLKFDVRAFGVYWRMSAIISKTMLRVFLIEECCLAWEHQHFVGNQIGLYLFLLRACVLGDDSSEHDGPVFADV